MSFPGNPHSLGAEAIHEFYMSILNCMPDAIYWIDKECHLQGCNQAFIQLIAQNQPVKDSPYEHMTQSAHWDKARVEEFKLDDMSAIFSGQTSKRLEKPITNKKGKTFYFQATRIPVRSHSNQVTGLIVILTILPEQQLPQEEGFKLKENQIRSLNKENPPAVLVVEDSFLTQCVEKALFAELNCQVDVADSLENALSLFQPNKYDLVIMDIGLKGTTGYVVAKKLRLLENDSGSHVPIVALTGYDADKIKEDCQQYKMDGVITKPLSSAQAEGLIARYVHHQRVHVKGLKENI
jgi:CheY-like chemotaxis protein